MANRIWRICLVAGAYPTPEGRTTSGSGVAIQTIAEGLRAAGHEVYVVTDSWELGRGQTETGIQIYGIRCGQWHYYLHKLPILGQWLSLPVREWELSAANQRGRLAFGLPFDLVIGTETGALFLANGQTPLIIAANGEEYTFEKYMPKERPSPIPVKYRLSRMLQRRSLQSAYKLITPSDSHAKELRGEMGEGVTMSTLLYTLLDSWKAQLQDRGQVEREPYRVLFVGRWQSLKGVIDVLNAFKKVSQSLPNATLTLIGSYHPSLSQATLEAHIESLGIAADRITWLHLASRSTLAEWYHRASVLLMPSYYETFGFVALEAMTTGLPIVAYRSGALPEVIADGGVLVERGDQSGLADATLRILTDSAYRIALSQAGMQRSELFSQKRYVDLWLALLEKVIPT